MRRLNLMLVFNGWTLLVAATATTNELQVAQTSSSIHSVRTPRQLRLSQVLPLQLDLTNSSASTISSNDAQQRVCVSVPIEMNTRGSGGSGMLVGSSATIANQSHDYVSSSSGNGRQNTPSSNDVAKININSPIERRNALVPQPLTEDDIRLLTDYVDALSKRIIYPYEASDSVFENIMGVPTFTELFTTPRGLLGLLARGALLYESFVMNDVTIGLFDFHYFKSIRNLDNYYPYLAFQKGNISDIFETGLAYLGMLLVVMPSYGMQCMDGCKRIFSFFKRYCSRSDDHKILHNPKNEQLITASSITLTVGSAVATLPKLYDLIQRLTGTYIGSGQFLTMFVYSISNFYTLFDSSTTYVHSKIHYYFNGDCPLTAGNRTTLLNITQNAIIRWMALSDSEKIQNYNQLFASQAGETDVSRFYRMLFFLFDFGKTDPVPKPEEPKIRKGLRWFSEVVASAVGPLSFQVIQTTVKSQLESLGVEERHSQGIGYFAASIGSVFTTVLSRNVVNKSLTQLYDAWETVYKDVDDISSSLYASSSSGYTSHDRFRKYVTTYNQINGWLLGITMGKNVFDALPFPNWVRYPAAVVAAIASGSLETLFLQRWTHKLVNIVDKNILQKVGCLKSMADPVGVMSDEFIEFVRDFRLWVTRMPAPVIHNMCALAVNPGLRGQLFRAEA